MKNFKLILFVLLLAFVLVGCNSSTDSDNESENESNNDSSSEETDNDEGSEEGTSGGTLKIAIDGPPPTLDQPVSTATAARDAARFVFEGLMTTDADFNAVPMLAESVDTEDNQTYTFKLREGIKFHNGEEMTAEDVVASMYRWMEISTVTGNVFKDATWTAEDDYTVVLELANPSSLTLDTLASAKQAAGIMPKEIVENAPVEGVDEYIGTGPFKFEEWKQDQYIHYTKFEDYQPLDTPASGLSGKREALVDEVYLYIVPDTSTRIAGLQTGEYDFAYGVPYDYYDQINADENLETILTPSSNQMIGFNNLEGISTNPEIRKAINMIIDSNEVMLGAFPNPEFFWLDSGYMDMNITPWYTEAGKEHYNQANVEEAKKILDEFGYDGEEIKFLATRDYDHHYNTSVIVTEQLKQAGLNVTLEIYDWPTVLDIQGNRPSEWDMYMTSASTVSTPPQLIGLSPRFGGVYPEVSELISSIETAPTQEEAFEYWEELQGKLWEEYLPIVHIGGYNALYGHNTKVKGLETSTGPIFWNVTVSE
ncbi:ABC transporter substrate-binding protein [Ornithinibacillus sp. 4-3]|uniref:ABC transporter substrate-binding protein n=1 Tax=Ornithinibacillus sp. 4-3 TaxID=3231488 RepID=A0AB39HPF1_9BACI